MYINKIVENNDVEMFFDSIRKNNFKGVKKFLLTGFNPNQTNAKGRTALSFINNSNIDMGEMLVSYGADINMSFGKFDDYLLLKACSIQCEDLVRFCLRHQANPNVANNEGINPLLIVTLSSMNSVSILKLLIEHGADIDVFSESNDTPLMNTSLYGTYEMADVLLQAGANPNYINNYGYTVVDLAYRYKNVDLMKALYDHKEKLSERNWKTLSQLKQKYNF